MYNLTTHQTNGYIDLRSDTVTQPTESMRKAMYEAELGDDVYGEDPTVNRLQELSAQKLGKEAGLLVLSGTMGNLVCLLTHCGRGDEAIMGNRAHTFSSEQGAASGLGGIHPHTLPNQPDGTLDLRQIEAAIRGDNEHYPRTKLICIENTQNSTGGRVLSPAYMSAFGQIAKQHQISVHVDGARIFNAAVALGMDASALAADADSLTFCLSKGLACPLGSVVVGDEDFVHEARRNRKILGGGMRQAGIFAAAGIVALNEMVERLDDDHRNAKTLAEGLSAIPGMTIDPSIVETNIVYFELTAPKFTPGAFAARMKERGVLFSAGAARRIRLVTHYGIELHHITHTLRAFSQVLGEAA
ncbi:MAG: low-specificity L-threonine aldolase [Chloroflexi bacterium]|nr:low-specificity L-threonine aldolase [Chloroflexota bacterium]